MIAERIGNRGYLVRLRVCSARLLTIAALLVFFELVYMSAQWVLSVQTHLAAVYQSSIVRVVWLPDADSVEARSCTYFIGLSTVASRFDWPPAPAFAVAF